MNRRNLVAIFLGGVLPSLLIGGIIFAGVAAGGSKPGSPEPHGLTVQLSNWKVAPDHQSMPAGPVVLDAVHMNEDHGGGHETVDSHGAGATHNLVVLRALADGSYEAMGRTRDLAMGERVSLTVRLEPGEYEFLCDVVEEIDGEVVSHTREGMRTTVTVT